MNQALLRYEWNEMPWPRLEASVFKLQRRIYRAASRDDVKGVHRLQKLLFGSVSAKLLAVRRVTQDNKGRKTAGVDGVAKLGPKERMDLVERLDLSEPSRPARRIWIPKPGKEEKRPLGIPTMRDRAKQALMKMGLEPEWEARFEPNSYGFRPGRSCHDAIEAIFGSIKNKEAFVLDADIAGCFDNIDHDALLDRLGNTPTVRKIVRGWLKAGVVDMDVFQSSESGTPQGGVISPLLANVALHGLENDTRAALREDLFEYQKRKHGKASRTLSGRTLSVIRYADDFVVLHESEEIVLKAKDFIEQWLKGIGLELKPSKTRIAHTLNPRQDELPGFDFLGFTVRQFPSKETKLGRKLLIKPSKESVKRHNRSIRDALRAMRGAPQDAVIRKLNPIVKGWSRYYCSAVSRKAFEWLGDQTHGKLWRWACFRHSHKGERWIKRKYFRAHGGDLWRFMTHDGLFLMRHGDHAIKRHVKVQGTKSPYDGDWAYWGKRLARYPMLSPRTARLLKQQDGQCSHCKKQFKWDDLPEVHHQDGNHRNNAGANLRLLHLHCHDDVHGKGSACQAPNY